MKEKEAASMLGVPANTAAVLKKYNFRIQKKYGQNFLIDTHVLEKIVQTAGITAQDFVLEIGPGIGTMTEYLACSAAKVTAVEIDKALIPILAETLNAYDNVHILEGDILKLDLQNLIAEESGGRPVKAAANLPYYITTPILMRLLEERLPITSITVMVQHEVAERMQAGPGSKEYGALSLAVQYYADAYLAANVPPNCFMPRPKVASAVVHLTIHEQPPVPVQDEKLMFRLIRAAFNQRRKTLSNALLNGANLDLSREELDEKIRRAGIDPGIRGEKLGLEEFARLADAVYDSCLCRSGKS